MTTSFQDTDAGTSSETFWIGRPYLQVPPNGISGAACSCGARAVWPAGNKQRWDRDIPDFRALTAGRRRDIKGLVRITWKYEGARNEDVEKSFDRISCCGG